MSGHIYILNEREFINSGENVYKIAMTGNLIKRMNKFPRGSILLLAIHSDNVRYAEQFQIMDMDTFKATLN
jgi:hypothetical protein